MKEEYKYTATTVSLIKYHFVFCPRYRRKIFLIPGITERFKELVKEACGKHEIDVLAIECDNDHVYMLVSAMPQMSASEIMKHIKNGTANILREEFSELSKMPSLWTRSYFVSTAEKIDSETIEWYVGTQKTRY